MSVSFCSGSHNCGSTSGPDGIFAHPFRMFGNKILHADMYGKQFSSVDAAHKAMHDHGYGVLYFPRSSVPLPLFARHASERRQARFDALYRLWRWKLRHGLPCEKEANQVRILAQKVSIFHPVASALNKGKWNTKPEPMKITKAWNRITR